MGQSRSIVREAGDPLDKTGVPLDELGGLRQIPIPARVHIRILRSLLIIYWRMKLFDDNRPR